jgi:serine/threonine-protein kinase RsbW
VTAFGTTEDDPFLIAIEAARVAGEGVAHWWTDLHDAANSAMTSESLDDLIREALLVLSQALSADTVSVLLANDEEDEIVVRLGIGLQREVTRELGIHAGEGMAGRVLADRRTLVIDDLSEIQLASPALHESGVRSLVAVPMEASGRILGVLHAGSRELRHFGPASARALEIIADRLAGAIERVRLFEAERAARLRAQLVAERLRSIQSITSQLAAASTAHAAALVLAEWAAFGIPHHAPAWSSVWLVRGDRLERVFSSLDSPEAAQTLPLGSEEPLAVAARTMTPVFAGDQAEAIDRFPILATRELLSQSFALVPISSGGPCLGVLVIGHDVPQSFDDEEREFLSAVVTQAAQALDRAKLQAEQAHMAEVLSFLADAARATAEASDFPGALERLAGLALGVLGDICLIDVVGPDGRLQRMVARHRDPAWQEPTDRLSTEYPPDSAGTHPAVDVINTGKSRWSPEMSDAFLRETTRDEGHLELVRKLGFRSYLTVPLVSGHEVVGALTLVSTRAAFREDDVGFAEGLAEQVAAVVANARRHDITLQTSRILQASLLPQALPQIPGVTVGYRYVAATTGIEVGGDFYDVIRLPSGAVGLAVGDVEGHDRAAAAMMGHLRSAARSLAGQVRSPAALVNTLQWSWDLLGFDRTATGVFCRLDQVSGEISIASAGHYPPLLVGPDGAAFVPVPNGPPLGVPSTVVAEWSGRLDERQLLLLYTDGAVDERRLGPEAGMDRLAQVSVGISPLEPQELCDRIVDSLDDQRDDDVAVLALRSERG